MESLQPGEPADRAEPPNESGPGARSGFRARSESAKTSDSGARPERRLADPGLGAEARAADPNESAADVVDSSLDTLGSGVDAVRAALNRARDAAKAKGLRPSAPGSASPQRVSDDSRHDAARRRVNARRRGGGGLSGSGPDDRDPQTFGSLIERLIAERGWKEDVSVGGVMGRWPEIVGAEVAEHATPESFVDGVLTVRTDSTAWATQLRLMLPRYEERINEEVGDGVVQRIVVLGPAAPSWRKGPRSAPGGRGPRDTYG